MKSTAVQVSDLRRMYKAPSGCRDMAFGCFFLVGSDGCDHGRDGLVGLVWLVGNC